MTMLFLHLSVQLNKNKLYSQAPNIPCTFSNNVLLCSQFSVHTTMYNRCYNDVVYAVSKTWDKLLDKHLKSTHTQKKSTSICIQIYSTWLISISYTNYQKLTDLFRFFRFKCFYYIFTVKSWKVNERGEERYYTDFVIHDSCLNPYATGESIKSYYSYKTSLILWENYSQKKGLKRIALIWYIKLLLWQLHREGISA